MEKSLRELARFMIKELANLIKNFINPELKFTNKTIPEDDPRQRKPSIDLAKEILDWEPYIELEEGLKKTISWFKKNL